MSGREYRFDRRAPLGKADGYSNVFEGLNEEGAAVAVKRVRIPSGNQTDLKRRERELDVGYVLKDADPEPTNLLAPLDHGVVDDDLLIVLPRANESLAQAVRTAQRFDSQATVAILRDICEGLKQLAAMGIRHRDLKPENILSMDNRWMIADFGLSRDVTQPTASHTFAYGAPVGTFPYIAPELWRGARPTVYSDLYSLGVIVYELLTGSPPFSGPYEDDFARQHESENVAPLPSETDPALARTVYGLLKKSPGSRPSDARMVLSMVERVGERGLSEAQSSLISSMSALSYRTSEREAAVLKEQQDQETLEQRRELAVAQMNFYVAEAAERVKGAMNEPETDAEKINQAGRIFLRWGDAAVLLIPAPFPSDGNLEPSGDIAHAFAVQAVKRSRQTSGGWSAFDTHMVATVVAIAASSEGLDWEVWRFQREVYDPNPRSTDSTVGPSVVYIGVPPTTATMLSDLSEWRHTPDPSLEVEQFDVDWLLAALAQTVDRL